MVTTRPTGTWLALAGGHRCAVPRRLRRYADGTIRSIRPAAEGSAAMINYLGACPRRPGGRSGSSRHGHRTAARHPGADRRRPARAHRYPDRADLRGGHEYFQLACMGGFPEVRERSAGAPRSRWFSDYLRTVTQRDIRELKQIEQLERLPRLLRLVAALTAQELNVAEVALLETFVVNELLKLREATEFESDLYHFRDRDRREIDGVLEAPDGRVVAVEVKASSSVNAHDFRYLAFARDRLGEGPARRTVRHRDRVLHGPPPAAVRRSAVGAPDQPALWGGGPAPT